MDWQLSAHQSIQSRTQKKGGCPLLEVSKKVFLDKQESNTLVMMSDEFSEGDQRFREFAAHIKS